MKAQRGQVLPLARQGAPRERGRAALQQSQAEKCPQECDPLLEQYLKNLSDQAGSR
jgi:hypothetical protein